MKGEGGSMVVSGNRRCCCEAPVRCRDWLCGHDMWKFISRFTLQNLFFLVMAIRFSATAVRASEGTSAVYTGKHTWPSLSRPTLEMAVTPRVGGYMRPCGRVSGNGLGETESHWEKILQKATLHSRWRAATCWVKFACHCCRRHST
jgi:hypothetical protein